MAVKLIRRLLSIEDYHSMAKAGILLPDEKVELIRGEIFTMSPIGSKHAKTVIRFNRIFWRLLGETVCISSQNPIHISPNSEPEPDVLLLKPHPDDYGFGHPEAKDVLLLVEVAESSYDTDKNVKLPLYAEAGVPIVWLVNLNKDEIEVYEYPNNQQYRNKKVYQIEDVLTLPVGDFQIKIRDILA